MKKMCLLLLVLTLFAFRDDNEKMLKVEMPLSVWNHHFEKLQTVRNYVDNSNLPHGDVKYIVGTIDSLLLDLSKQLRLQIDNDKKKP